MKVNKWIVGVGAAMGIVSVFCKWMSVDKELTGALANLPVSGMQNGGAVFLVLLALPAMAATIGALKRFGRGMAVLALIGGLLSSLLAMVKFGDISKAAALGKQLSVTISVAPALWLLLLGSLAAALGGIVGLIKPERAAQAAPVRT